MIVEKSDRLKIKSPEKIMDELYPLALDYISLLRKNHLCTTYADGETVIERSILEKGLVKAEQHEFALKINQQKRFTAAKKSLINAGLIKCSASNLM